MIDGGGRRRFYSVSEADHRHPPRASEDRRAFLRCLPSSIKDGLTERLIRLPTIFSKSSGQCLPKHFQSMKLPHTPFLLCLLLAVTSQPSVCLLSPTLRLSIQKSLLSQLFPTWSLMQITSHSVCSDIIKGQG